MNITDWQASIPKAAIEIRHENTVAGTKLWEPEASRNSTKTNDSHTQSGVAFEILAPLKALV